MLCVCVRDSSSSSNSSNSSSSSSSRKEENLSLGGGLGRERPRFSGLCKVAQFCCNPGKEDEEEIARIGDRGAAIKMGGGSLSLLPLFHQRSTTVLFLFLSLFFWGWVGYKFVQH